MEKEMKETKGDISVALLVVTLAAIPIGLMVTAMVFIVTCLAIG